jgi:hypothetical protein
MTIGTHISTYAGLPVVEYRKGERPADPAAVAWRVDESVYNEADQNGGLESFLAEPWIGEVTTLVLGDWGEAFDSPPPIDELVAAAGRLTSLRSFFLGEMTFEECEISWINQADVTPLLAAYPLLEVLTIRGSEGLSISPVRHASLRSLTLESGGLPASVVRAVGECDLPALTHLELWLGTDNYGGDATVDDLRQILGGTRLPRLTSLGLRDAEIADQVAGAVAGAPVVARLEELDLSLGMLTDAGASALLTGQPLTHLRRLDLHHHFLSQPMMDRLTAELGEAGVELEISEAGDPDSDDRYIAVAE